MTAPLVTRVSRADGAAVGDAAQRLAAGGLVAFPTETVYGLGADATNGRAIARLYEAKGRPAFNPLIAHVADLAAAKALARFSAAAERLGQNFWPGPLTLVLPKAETCPVAELATALHAASERGRLDTVRSCAGALLRLGYRVELLDVGVRLVPLAASAARGSL